MKKEMKAVICVILSIWFFFMGFELGSYREKKNMVAQPSVQNVPQTAATQQTTAAPQTTAPQTETTASAAEQTTAATSGEQEQTTKKEDNNAPKDPASLSKSEILEAATKAINNMKAEQNMTAVQTENTQINVTSCSIQSAVSLINNIINKMTGEKSATYQFVNGQATGVRPDGSAVEDEGVVSPTQVIPPKSQNFGLTEAGLADASAAKDGENTVYTLKLVPESATFEAPAPAHNSVAIGYLDLSKIDISGATITKADMQYPGSTVIATVNPEGKLIKLDLNLPMTGYGEAKVVFANGNASFDGSQHEVWTFTY